MRFVSPTRGMLDFDQMFEEIVGYVRQDLDSSYKLIIGTDSQTREGAVCFVTAVVIHRLGKGARYFYHKRTQRRIESLRQRIFYEASLSLALAGRISDRLASTGLEGMNVEIHLDVGHNGNTRDLIREITGMVAGSGFQPRIKPESYGASTVADRYTK